MSNIVDAATGRLRSAVFGTEDARLRATWRVLLAMPVLWLLTGGILTGNLQASVDLIPSGEAPGAGLAQSLLHAGFVLLAVTGWARYVDRQPLATYGVSVSTAWLRDALIGFLAVIIGLVTWTGLGAIVGGTSVQVSPATPEESVLAWVVVPAGALLLHAAVQQVVFFRVILKNAAEGLHARGVDPRRAALASVPVAVLFFVLMHGSGTPLRLLDLAVAGGVFGLLYLHTGELGLGIGAHFGTLYAGSLVAAVIRVTGSLSGVLGTVDQYGFPKLAVAYLVLLGWLVWSRGASSIQPDIAHRYRD